MPGGHKDTMFHKKLSVFIFNFVTLSLCGIK